MDFQHSTIHELAELLASGKTTAVQLLDDFLGRIDAFDSKIGAFIRIDRDAARKAAEESDARRTAGRQLSAYDGILIGIKDCISVKGDYIASASQIYRSAKLNIAHRRCISLSAMRKHNNSRS